MLLSVLLEACFLGGRGWCRDLLVLWMGFKCLGVGAVWGGLGRLDLARVSKIALVVIVCSSFR